MKQCLEIILQIPELEQELWIAKLYDLNFENFIEESETLSAFIEEDLWTKDVQDLVVSKLNYAEISYRIQSHEPRDWNAVWEANFDPILIQDKLYVRANFHPVIENIETEILISPKMAFGTGHHATTSMILNWMVEKDLNDLDVLDFGCGTGILGIYAKKKECKSLVLIDNDVHAVENAFEHCQINQVIADQILLGSSAQIPNQSFDLIFANITKNVLEECMGALSSKLKPHASLIISGFLEEDQESMRILIANHSLQLLETMQEKDWIAMYVKKQ